MNVYRHMETSELQKLYRRLVIEGVGYIERGIIPSTGRKSLRQAKKIARELDRRKEPK